jgi:hypothetical protein
MLTVGKVEVWPLDDRANPHLVAACKVDMGAGILSGVMIVQRGRRPLRVSLPGCFQAKGGGHFRQIEDAVLAAYLERIGVRPRLAVHTA